MMKYTMVASVIAMMSALDSVVEQYKLPPEAAYELFSNEFQNKMRSLSKEFGEKIRNGEIDVLPQEERPG